MNNQFHVKLLYQKEKQKRKKTVCFQGPHTPDTRASFIYHNEFEHMLHSVCCSRSWRQNNVQRKPRFAGTDILLELSSTLAHGYEIWGKGLCTVLTVGKAIRVTWSKHRGDCVCSGTKFESVPWAHLLVRVKGFTHFKTELIYVP